MARSKVKPRKQAVKEPHMMASSQNKKSQRMVKEISKARITVQQRMIPMAPFSRLVKDILQRCAEWSGLSNSDYRVTREFLDCLHCATEIYLTQYFEDLNFLALHAKRVTIMKGDHEKLHQIKRVRKDALIRF